MKKKNIFLWGATPEVPKDEPYDVSYRRSGNNFGNILIANGVVSVLSECEYVSRSHLSGPAEANERCDHIVIPAANFLWKGFDLGFMADFIEATYLPVTIVGLGAQSHDRSIISEIHPNTLRLIRVIADRSVSVGVRGYYTAEVLAAHGILNVEVLGCPSLYTNLKPPEKISPLMEDDLGNIAVNFSRRVSGHAMSPPALQAAENALLKIALRYDLSFVAQDELEELSLAFNNGDEKIGEPVAAYFSATAKNKVIEYFRRKTKYFCNVTDWSAFVREHTGTAGSRMHGNIISLINGKAGFVLAHDSRTVEMCALTGIPYLNIKCIDPVTFTEKDLIESMLSADYRHFTLNMHKLFGKYRDFLRQHSLPNKLDSQDLQDADNHVIDSAGDIQ